MLDNKGITNSGIPESEILEVEILDTNDTEHSYTKDINDTNKDTSKELAEILFENSTEILETELVSKNTAILFSFFGDIHNAKKFVNIIYLAKKKVDNFEHKENPKNLRAVLAGERWKMTIEEKAKDFMFKMKEYIQKDNPINNLEKYWFQVMEIFLGRCFTNGEDLRLQ